MKKIIYLLLTLYIGSTVSLNAQVTIGSDQKPNNGAVLDARAVDKRGGVLLPQVALTGIDVWAPVSALQSDTVQGMIVYNTNTSLNNGLLGQGTYIWNKKKWELLTPINSTILVASVKLTATPDKPRIDVGDIFQLTTTILPANASNKNISWSSSPAGVVELSNTSSGGATVTAIGTGSVSIIAVAVDGSFAMAVYNVAVNAPFSCGQNGTAGAVTVASGKQYKTHRYATGSAGAVECWMVENSSEGYYSTGNRTFETDPNKNNGAYYYWKEAMAAGFLDTPCPQGWAIPTSAQFTYLRDIVNGDNTGVLSTGRWWTGTFGNDNNAFAGGNISDQYSLILSRWEGYQTVGSWWTSDVDSYSIGFRAGNYFYSRGSVTSVNNATSTVPRQVGLDRGTYNDASHLSVRCVRAL